MLSLEREVPTALLRQCEKITLPIAPQLKVSVSVSVSVAVVVAVVVLLRVQHAHFHVRGLMYKTVAPAGYDGFDALLTKARDGWLKALAVWLDELFADAAQCCECKVFLRTLLYLLSLMQRELFLCSASSASMCTCVCCVTYMCVCVFAFVTLFCSFPLSHHHLDCLHEQGTSRRCSCSSKPTPSALCRGQSLALPSSPCTRSQQRLNPRHLQIQTPPHVSVLRLVCSLLLPSLSSPFP